MDSPKEIFRQGKYIITKIYLPLDDGETQIKYFLGVDDNKEKYGIYYCFDDALDGIKTLIKRGLYESNKKRHDS